MTNFSKRLVEVDEILKYLSKEDYIKIPQNIIKYIKNNKDNTYIWKYDKSKKLKDQDVCDDTIAILSYLNMEYLLNPDQKAFMKKLHYLNDKKSPKHI